MEFRRGGIFLEDNFFQAVGRQVGQIVLVERHTVKQKPGIRVSNEAFKIDPLIITPIASIPMVLVVLIAAGFRPKRKKSQKPDESK